MAEAQICVLLLMQAGLDQLELLAQAPKGLTAEARKRAELLSTRLKELSEASLLEPGGRAKLPPLASAAASPAASVTPQAPMASGPVIAAGPTDPSVPAERTMPSPAAITESVAPVTPAAPAAPATPTMPAAPAAPAATPVAAPVTPARVSALGRRGTSSKKLYKKAFNTIRFVNQEALMEPRTFELLVSAEHMGMTPEELAREVARRDAMAAPTHTSTVVTAFARLKMRAKAKASRSSGGGGGGSKVAATAPYEADEEDARGDDTAARLRRIEGAAQIVDEQESPVDRWMISPASSRLAAWSAHMLVCIAVYALVTPVVLAFFKPPPARRLLVMVKTPNPDATRHLYCVPGRARVQAARARRAQRRTHGAARVSSKR